ncbi:MAG: hypothetical protein GY821_06645 [Gammaproteobacteria bacterium]|nr:hypothetical protein [Gammaproteobacteria bacterium]
MVKGETLFLDGMCDEPWQQKDRLCCGEAETLEDAIEQAEQLSQRHHYLFAAQSLYDAYADDDGACHRYDNAIDFLPEQITICQTPGHPDTLPPLRSGTPLPNGGICWQAPVQSSAIGESHAQ